MADTGYRLRADVLATTIGAYNNIYRALYRLRSGTGTPDDLRLAAAVLDAGGFTEDAARVRAMDGR